MSCPARQYPLKRPEGHRPPVPRWHLQFDPDVHRACALYIGLQLHKDASEVHSKTALQTGVSQAVNALREFIREHAKNSVFEEFESMDWNEEDIRHVFVCYWNNVDQYTNFLQTKLQLRKLHPSIIPKEIRSHVGIWIEGFNVPPSRLETNYSGLDYLPGFARLPKSRTEEHTLTAYWGAARDRLSDSANDAFDEPPSTKLRFRKINKSDNEHIVTTNSYNTVHIRTGQYWQNCPEEESHSYEHNLEPTLRSGLSYLRSTPSSGASGLRYIRNLPTDLSSSTDCGSASGQSILGSGLSCLRSAASLSGSRDTHNAPEKSAPSHDTAKSPEGPLKETCVTGYFTSLEALENWAKSHKSHLAIYNGAMRHAKKFGAERKFRTWHEVVVLKTGDGWFEYFNCEEGTGVMGSGEDMEYYK